MTESRVSSVGVVNEAYNEVKEYLRHLRGTIDKHVVPEILSAKYLKICNELEHVSEFRIVNERGGE